MNTRMLHGLTGAVWGLLLGALGGVFTVAAGAGFSWIFLFGDSPWPEAAGWLLPALGLGVFAIVLFACVALGLRAGRQAAAAAPEDTARRHAAARRLCATGVLLALVLAGAVTMRLTGQEDAREIADRRAAGFEILQSERQRLAAVSVSRPPRPMSSRLTKLQKKTKKISKNHKVDYIIYRVSDVYLKNFIENIAILLPFLSANSKEENNN